MTNAGSVILAPQNPLDGRTGGGLPPPRTLPIASAFGDTDVEFFDRKFFWPKTFSVEHFLGRKLFRPKIFRPKNSRPKNFSVEKFAVRIAEGGSNGEGPGGGGPPRSVRNSSWPWLYQVVQFIMGAWDAREDVQRCLVMDFRNLW